MATDTTLTKAEKALAVQIGFDEEVLQRVKHETGAAKLKSVAKTELWGDEEDETPVEEAYALTVEVPGAVSEETVLRLRPLLIERGYQPFLIESRLDLGGRKHPDRIAVLRDADPLAPVRFVGTSAGNYDLGPEDILARLEDWQSRFRFDVLGAEGDRLHLRLHTMPRDLDAFAEELYEFCPDLLDQGIEVMIEDAYDMLSEEQQADIDARTEADTGDEEGKTHRIALKILAETIEKERRIGLWWD